MAARVTSKAVAGGVWTSDRVRQESQDHLATASRSRGRGTKESPSRASKGNLRFGVCRTHLNELSHLGICRISEPIIYISRIPEDEEWARDIESHLGSLARSHGLMITGGPNPGDPISSWFQETISSAKVVVVVISAKYLSSAFYEDQRQMLVDRVTEGKWVVPVIARICDFGAEDWIVELARVPSNGKEALAGLEPHACDNELADLSILIRGQFGAADIPLQDEEAVTDPPAVRPARKVPAMAALVLSCFAGLFFLFLWTFSHGIQVRAGVNFVKIPAGSFSLAEAAQDGLNQVKHVESFWLSIHEITNWQYRQLKRGHQGDDRLPVTRVTLNDAKGFCEHFGFYLPTETQWEYAARAGQDSDWLDVKVLDPYVWHRFNARGRVREVGQLAPNPWGLFDMFGNVAEWVEKESTQDLGGIVRGGSVNDVIHWREDKARSVLLGEEDEFMGFRCAFPVEPPPETSPGRSKA